MRGPTGYRPKKAWLRRLWGEVDRRARKQENKFAKGKTEPRNPAKTLLSFFGYRASTTHVYSMGE